MAFSGRPVRTGIFHDARFLLTKFFGAIVQQKTEPVGSVFCWTGLA